MSTPDPITTNSEDVLTCRAYIAPPNAEGVVGVEERIVAIKSSPKHAAFLDRTYISGDRTDYSGSGSRCVKTSNVTWIADDSRALNDATRNEAQTGVLI